MLEGGVPLGFPPHHHLARLRSFISCAFLSADFGRTDISTTCHIQNTPTTKEIPLFLGRYFGAFCWEFLANFFKVVVSNMFNFHPTWGDDPI